MKVIRGANNLKEPLSHPVVSIGNFDGVHVGHQEILRQAVEQARKRGGLAVAYTFRPHPQVYLRPESAPALISSYEEKQSLIAACGVDVMIEEPFNREFSSVSAERFFNENLRRLIGAEAIVVGYDFAFGKERAGSLEILKKLSQAAGVELTVVQPFKSGEEIASSTKIRQALAAGDVAAASRFLGRPFKFRGVVKQGDGRGRKIGFPTANIEAESRVVLPLGVYATIARVDGGEHLSVTNIGNRPTFDDKFPRTVVETHLLDASMDLYGQTVEIEFRARIRAEQRFASVDELKAQIARDCLAARSLLCS